VLSMSSLKGCLGFLLALDLSESSIDTTHKSVEDLQQIVYMVLVFSLVVQGAILTPTFKLFDLTENEHKHSKKSLINVEQKEKE